MERAISVVMPTFRRHGVLARALDRLAEQAGAPPFEVIVVDDPAEDDPASVRSVLEAAAIPVELVHRPEPGVSAARNAGWRRARAPVVLFLGDDILAKPELLARHQALHESAGGAEVGVLGRVEWAAELRVTPFMRWLESGIQFDYGAISGPIAHAGHLYASNVSLPTGLLERAGGFDERFRFGFEDIELGFRLDRLGLSLLYDPDALAEHLHAVTISDYARRMRTVAAEERRLVELHPELDARLHERFARALARPAPRGLGAHLASVVPEGMPWLGPRVSASAAAVFERSLAVAYEEGWEAASGSGSSSGGLSSGGP